MPTDLQITELELIFDKCIPSKVSALTPKLRGAIANLFPDEILLHQHVNNHYLYIYPRIQYRMEKEQAIITGVEEGTSLTEQLAKLLKGQNLKIGHHDINIINTIHYSATINFGETSNLLCYRFTSPWLALNQKNHKCWYESSQKEKMLLLQRCLAGNILSISKSFGYTVKEKLHIDISSLRPLNVKLKGMNMVGFLGEFTVNFQLLPKAGIGKGASRGFGRVEIVDN